MSPYNAFAAARHATSAWSAAGASGSSANTRIFVISDAAAAAQSSWASLVSFSSLLRFNATSTTRCGTWAVDHRVADLVRTGSPGRFLGDGVTGEGEKKDTGQQTASLILRERRSSQGNPAANRSAALQASTNFSATSARISPRPTSNSASSKGPTTRCSSQAQGLASPLTKRLASSKASSPTSNQRAASKSRQSGLRWIRS